MTFLKWHTTVNMESTVSTSMRSSHSPRGHSLRLAGSPSAAWNAVSLKTIMRPSTCRISHRGGQESPRPILMGFEEAKEPGALGEPRKQWPIVARQPAIEGPVPHGFERMQHAQGDDLAGPEVGFGVCGDGAQLLIDLVEQGRDQIHRGHTALLSWSRC